MQTHIWGLNAMNQQPNEIEIENLEIVLNILKLGYSSFSIEFLFAPHQWFFANINK